MTCTAEVDDVRELYFALHEAGEAAEGDSNDREIEVLNDALDLALGLLRKHNIIEKV